MINEKDIRRLLRRAAWALDCLLDDQKPVPDMFDVLYELRAAIGEGWRLDKIRKGAQGENYKAAS